jgi:WD40 repeat protein
MGDKIEMQLEECLSYQGDPICALDEDTMMYSTGNTLIFKGSRPGSAPEFFRENDLAGHVTTIASNWKSRSVAFSCRKNFPDIKIMAYPEKKLKATLKDGTDLEYSCIAFSREGGRVLGVGRLTDYKVCVWNVITQSKIKGCEAAMPFGCSFGTFDPADDDAFCTGGENGFICWKIDRSLEQTALKQTRCVLQPTDGETEERSDLRNTMTCHSWRSDSGCYCGNAAGEIVLFKKGSDTGEVVATLEESAGGDGTAVPAIAMAMCVTKSGLIVGCSDGSLKWYSLDDHHIEHTLTLPAAARGPMQITTITPSPFYSKIIVGTADGTIHDVTLESEDEDEGSEPTAVQVADCHGGATMGTIPVRTSSDAKLLQCTAGVDGTLRLWSAADSTPVMTKNFNVLEADEEHPTTTDADGVVITGPVPERCTCMANRGEDPLIAVGTSAGVLRLMIITSKHKSVEVLECFSAKLFMNKGISHLAFHPSKPWLAVASSDNARIFIVDLRPDGDFDSIGYIDGEAGQVFTKVLWSGTELIYSTTGSSFMSATITETSGTGSKKTKEYTTREYCKLSSPVSSFALHVQTGDCFVCNAASRTVQQYTVNSMANSTKQLEPDQSHTKGHNKGIYSLHYAPLQKNHLSVIAVLATGGVDGQIAFWLVKFAAGQTKLELAAQTTVHSSAVQKVSFLQDMGQTKIVSTDLTGGVNVFTLKGFNLPIRWESDKRLSASAYASKAYTRAEVQHTVEEPTWLEKALRYQQDMEEVEHARVRDRMRQTVDDIGNRLQSLLLKNTRAPEIERMKREEFVINLDGKEKVITDSLTQAGAVRAEIVDANYRTDIQTARVKSETWDSMSVQGKELHALKSGVICHNFSIRVKTEAENLKFDRVKRLRQVELLEQSSDLAESVDADLTEVPSNIQWLQNCGILEPTTDPTEAIDLRGEEEKKAEETKDEPEEEEEEEEEAAVADGLVAGAGGNLVEESLVKLLYHPARLRTSVQKRKQVFLLQELVEKIKASFNAKFDDVLAFKLKEMDRIESKNERIGQIVAELGTEKAFAKPSVHAMEEPESVLEVQESEMSTGQYETRTARAAREKAEEEKRLVDLERAKNDIGGRALMDMMNGTLEVKAGASEFDQELIREEWMDELTFEEMSEEQRKELEEFEQKQKTLIEEKEKHRKALELELKKLTTDISDISRLFDEKVQGLHMKYLRTVEATTCQDLYTLRLSQSVMRRAADQKALAEVATKLTAVTVDRDVMKKRCDDFRLKVEAVKGEHQALMDEDRLMERNFKRELQEASVQPLDQEALKVMVAAYKLRKKGTVGGDAAAALDTDSMAAAGAVDGAPRRKSLTRRSSNAGAKAKRGTVNQAGAGAARLSFAKKGGRGQGDAAKAAAAAAGMGGIVEDTGDPVIDAMAAAAAAQAQQASARDPYKSVDDDKREKELAEALEVPGVIDPEDDLPEGYTIDAGLLDRLSELRAKKIESENGLRVAGEKLRKMQAQLEALEEALMRLDDEISTLLSTEERLTTRAAQYDEKLEVLVAVKQGQNEVVGEPDALNTNYEDAMICDRAAVEWTNGGITKLGREQVSILQRIKNFRKSINYMHWVRSELTISPPTTSSLLLFSFALLTLPSSPHLPPFHL